MKRFGKKLSTQSGMTILEVLIAAAVFMTVFTLLVSLSTTITTKMSIPEKRLALIAANEQLRLAQLTRDTLPTIDTISFEEMSFRVRREIISAGNERLLDVTVTRLKSDRVITSLQGAVRAPK